MTRKSLLIINDVADLLGTSRRIVCTSLFRSPPLHACYCYRFERRHRDRSPQSYLQQREEFAVMFQLNTAPTLNKTDTNETTGIQ